MRLSNSALIKDAVEHGADVEIYKTSQCWVARVCYGENGDGFNYAYLEDDVFVGVLAQLLGIMENED